ncbi:MAG: glutathione S-transferase domain-containing protein [Alphaproteobacteria bacterium]
MPSFANLLAPMRYAKQSDAEFDAHADRLPLRKQFYRRMTQQGFGKEEIDSACDQIRQTCERVERSLDELGGPWILGGQYTLIDAQVTPSIDRMDDLGYDTIWQDLELMSDWWEDIKARPSYEAAFYFTSRLSEKFPEYFKTAAELKEERGY